MTASAPSLFDDMPLQVPPMAMQLRPYQQEAVDSIFAWFEKETGNPLVVLPTGAGKSLVLAAFIHAVLSSYPRERILVLTHVKELIAQNHAQLLRCWPGAPAGICSAGLRRREHDAPILFAGIQSVFRHAAKIGWVDLVLVDEAHLIPKEGFGMYRALLKDLLSMNSKLKVIGLTATPFRTGEGSLDAGADRMFHGIAYSANLVELIRDGYLSPVTTKATAAEVSTAGVHRQGGEFVAKELEDAALSGDLVERACREIIARGADRKAWLVFCCGVRHAKAVAAQIDAAGVTVACIFGDTDQGERDEAIAAFKAGRLRCIVNVNVLTTGFDAPHVDLIALLRPTCSPGLYCLDSETEILTSHGWKGIGRVGVGDCALAMDVATGKGVWSPVLGYVDRPLGADEKWVAYDAPRANFRVTNKHRMLYRTEHSVPWKIADAETVAGLRDGVYLPTAVRVEQPGVPLTDAEIYLIGILMTDGSITPFQATIYQSERYPAVLLRIEQALESAGIAYKKSRHLCASNFVERYARWRFSISAGEPRKGRAGKGLRYLFPWLDKDLSPALFSMSRRQFGLLVDAMWDSDGIKKANVDYVPRSKMICTARQVVADRMQALAAMHGYTAHMRWEHKGRKRPIAFVTFTDKDWRNVGGVGDRPQITVEAATEERVWCVETGHGTIVTRRRGKVTVMGNCQMVGRGLRKAPGKKDALILDFGSNAVRHGPIDAIAITQPKDKAEKPTDPTERVLAKACPKCQTLVAVAMRQCPDCGHMWPEPTPDHAAKPDEAATLVQGTHPTGGIERWEVQRTFYRLHRKDQSKPPTLCVEYRCGFHQTAREWICLEHTGYARHKAVAWWKSHGGQMPAPDTVDVALARIECRELLDVAVVTVDVRGEYPEVKGTRMAAREAGEQDFAAKPAPVNPSDYQDIPF